MIKRTYKLFGLKVLEITEDKVLFIPKSKKGKTEGEVLIYTPEDEKRDLEKEKKPIYEV